jgi:hypothetical protein
MSLSLTLSL